MKDEQKFRKCADDALASLSRLLISASEDYDFEVDLSDGALVVEFEQPPGKFIISSNQSAHQIWISALSKSYKLDFDTVENTFVLVATDQTLTVLVEQLLSKQIGEDVTL
jgi:iron donor protein CyaY